jgi:hypothetical protein
MRHFTPLALAALLAAPAGAQSSPSATLFSSGQSLVRRTLTVDIPRGTSTHPLVLGRFDPTTLSILDPGVTIGGVSYDPATDENALLRRNIGREFVFPVGTNDKVRARLVGMDPERWEILPGDISSANLTPGVVFSRPGRLVWLPELVPGDPVADVTITSDRARTALPVMYMVPGGNWGATYRLFLGRTARFEGIAQLNAGVLNLAQAEVQLLAGDMGQRFKDASVTTGRSSAMLAMEGVAAARGVPSNESIGEVQLYSLPGRVTFTPGAQMVVPLFAPATVAPELRLTVGGGLSYYGGVNQFPDEMEVPVDVSYRFERKQGTTFGDLPLPAGGVMVYATDKGGRIQLVGQGGIGHTAPGEELEISTGTAFDVTAKRTQTDYTTTREVVANNRTRTIATVGQRVVVTNAKDSAVTVEVREDRAGEWSVLTSSVPPVRRSSSRVVFRVTVPAKGEATLTYTTRVVW